MHPDRSAEIFNGTDESCMNIDFHIIKVFCCGILADLLNQPSSHIHPLIIRVNHKTENRLSLDTRLILFDGIRIKSVYAFLFHIITQMHSFFYTCVDISYLFYFLSYCVFYLSRMFLLKANPVKIVIVKVLLSFGITARKCVQTDKITNTFTANLTRDNFCGMLLLLIIYLSRGIR